MGALKRAESCGVRRHRRAGSEPVMDDDPAGSLPPCFFWRDDLNVIGLLIALASLVVEPRF